MSIAIVVKSLAEAIIVVGLCTAIVRGGSGNRMLADELNKLQPPVRPSGVFIDPPSNHTENF